MQLVTVYLITDICTSALYVSALYASYSAAFGSMTGFPV
jgi:hypothetical protein